MRYVVKVGKEFDLAEVPARGDGSINIQVNVGDKSGVAKSPPAWKIVVFASLAFSILVVIPPAAYGMATGDFSLLEAVAEFCTDLAESVVKFAISVIGKK